MNNLRRFLIGGAGAIAPLLLLIYKQDANAIFHNVDAGLICGWAFRSIALFILGGLVAYFHAEETKPMKVFQLGVSAPALISLFLADPANQKNNNEPSKPVSYHFSWVTSANAQSKSSISFPTNTSFVNSKIKKFQLPQESFSDKFWRGFTGSLPEKRFFVVLNSYNDTSAAKTEQLRLMKESGIQTKIFESPDKKGTYQLVAGEQLNNDEANSKVNLLNANNKLKIPAQKMEFNK